MKLNILGSEKPSLPEHKVYKWKSAKQSFTYWDGKEEQSIPMPVDFLIVFKTAKMTGFIDGKGAIWSNEILDYNKDIITVRCGDEILAKGTYKDVKSLAKGEGAGFTIVLYTIYNGEFAKVELSGAARTAFIESRLDVGNSVHVATTQEGKKGATKYFFPVFEKAVVDPKVLETGKALAEELKVYFNKREQYYADFYKEEFTDATITDPSKVKLTSEEMEAKLKESGKAFSEKQVTKEELKPELDSLPF